MNSNAPHGKTIQSTRTAFDIIEVIASRDRPSISEIANQVDCSRSTVHYHLKTLQQERYVVRDEGGIRLGLRMARLGDLALGQHRLTGVVEAPADSLASETGATAHVAVKEGDDLVWLYRSEGDGPAGPGGDVGAETAIHSSAYGQAILAHLPTDTVDELVSGDLRAVTDGTITDPDALRERLETIRDVGFAYSVEEFREGSSSIAAPIFDGAGEVVGAIGITDDRDRIDDPYKHTKARRFSEERPGRVQKAARIAGDRLTDE
jgi:DNA-binding IclR family transcriptional regulator